MKGTQHDIAFFQAFGKAVCFCLRFSQDVISSAIIRAPLSPNFPYRVGLVLGFFASMLYWKMSPSVLIRAPLARFFSRRVGDILHHFSIDFGVILGFGGYRWPPRALQKSS